MVVPLGSGHLVERLQLAGCLVGILDIRADEVLVKRQKDVLLLCFGHCLNLLYIGGDGVLWKTAPVVNCIIHLLT